MVILRRLVGTLVIFYSFAILWQVFVSANLVAQMPLRGLSLSVLTVLLFGSYLLGGVRLVRRQPLGKVIPFAALMLLAVSVLVVEANIRKSLADALLVLVFNATPLALLVLARRGGMLPVVH